MKYIQITFKILFHINFLKVAAEIKLGLCITELISLSTSLAVCERQHLGKRNAKLHYVKYKVQIESKAEENYAYISFEACLFLSDIEGKLEL